MVSISILRCGSGIIVFLGYIRPLGGLTVWEKFACKYGLDWPEGLDGPYQTGRGWGEWINGSGRLIGSSTIG